MIFRGRTRHRVLDRRWAGRAGTPENRVKRSTAHVVTMTTTHRTTHRGRVPSTVLIIVIAILIAATISMWTQAEATQNIEQQITDRQHTQAQLSDQARTLRESTSNYDTAQAALRAQLTSTTGLAQ